MQEWIPGELHGANCLAVQGRVVVAYTQKSLQLNHESWGYGVANQTTREPELLEILARLVRETRYTGLANLDFIRDGSGRFHLLECNPRPWATIGLGLDAGLDLPRMLLELLIKGEEPKASVYETGVVSVQLLPEAMAAWLRGFPGPRMFWRRVAATFALPHGCRRVLHSGPGLNNLRYTVGMALNAWL